MKVCPGRRAALKQPHSKRFAKPEAVGRKRQRLECGCFSAAFRPPSILTLLLGITLLCGCHRAPEPASSAGSNAVVQGATIAPLSTNAAASNAPAPFVPADYSQPDIIRGGVIQLGWEKLSGFKFDVYEVYSETNSGRALLRSDDTIPAPMKAYDGKEVSVAGFVLPLRTRKGLVTEFLLLRDQGTCCFGARAQINHFIRVKHPAGIGLGDAVPWRVTGTLRVGEIYIQGYLTGIYQMEADNASPDTPPPRTAP